jgi:hypothetical protein
MNKLIKLPFALLIGFAVLTSSCRKDDPEAENEEELITTVQLTFASVTGGSPIIAKWRDLDGTGGNPPIVDPITLQRGVTYNMTVQVLDETKTPAENLNEEIEREANEHQFFFTTSGLTGMAITYNDTDGNNRPIGLRNRVTTPSNAATGTMTVILRHELNKAAAGVSSGDITNAGGDTDVQTAPPFSVTVL